MKENTQKKENFIKRFNLLPKVLCIFVAFLIWLYVTAVESPEHEETVSGIPIELVGASTIESQHNLSIFNGYDITLDLVVKGQQSTISRYTENDYTITADISSITSAGRYTIDLSFDMPSGVTLSGSSRQSIDIYVDEKASASIEVRPSVRYISQYSIGDYELDYDVITVTGPRKLIDEVGYAEVIVDAGQISSTTTVSGSLTLKSTSNTVMSNPYLKLSKSEVKVTVPVFVSKEVEVRVPYKYDFYNNETASVKVEPSTVTLEGDPAVLENVNYIYTSLVNEKDISDNTVLNLPLQIPDHIKLSKEESETVNVSVSHIGTQKKTISVSTDNIEVIGADGIKYNILGDTISIVFRGKSEILKGISAKHIKLTVDLTGYDDSETTVYLPVTVTFDSESYKAYVINISDYTVQVKIG